MSKKRKQTPLNSRQKSYLRGLGHHLDNKAMLGREGLADNVLKTVNEILAAHELVKIKLQENFPLDRKEAGPAVAEATGSALVQILGRTILLYRGNPDLQDDRRIRLPR